MMESVMTSEMNPSHNSRILANNILTAEANVPPFYAPRELLVAQAYQLNGDDLASALGIEKPRWYYRIFVWVQCVVLMLLSYSYPWMPAFAQREGDRVCASNKYSHTTKPTHNHYPPLPRKPSDFSAYIRRAEFDCG